MSPITFHPPLGSHHTITIPSHLTFSTNNASTKTIDIKFIATGIDSLNETDKVEVWTDAPSVGWEGGWRAIPFEQKGGAGLKDDESERSKELSGFDSAPVLDLSDSSEAPASSEQTDTPTPTLTYLSAHLPLPTHFPSTATYTFGFTYRITYPDGNIWWLGNESGNGSITVEVVGGGAAGESEQGKNLGSWDGLGGFWIEDGEGGERKWEGFVLAKDGDDQSSALTILPLDNTNESNTLKPTNHLLAYIFPSISSSTSAEPPHSITSVLPIGIDALTLAPAMKGTQLVVTKGGARLSLAGRDGDEKVDQDKDGKKAFVVSGDDLSSLISGLATVNSIKGISTASDTSAHHKAFLTSFNVGADSTITSKHKQNRLLIYASNPTPSSPATSAIHQVGLRIPKDVFSAFGGSSADTGSIRLAVWSEKLRKAVLLDSQEQDQGRSQTGDRSLQIRMQEETISLDLVEMISVPKDTADEAEADWVGAITDGVEVVLRPATSREETYEEEVEEEVKPEVAPAESPRAAEVDVSNDGTSAGIENANTGAAKPSEAIQKPIIDTKTVIDGSPTDTEESGPISSSGPSVDDDISINDHTDEHDLLMPGHNSLQHGATSSGALWIVLSFFHSFWIKSGLSWLWMRLTGQDQIADGAEHREGEGYVQVVEEEESGIEIIDVPEQSEQAVQDETAERKIPDESTPLLSGTSTLVNSPLQKISSTFSEVASAFPKASQPIKQAKPAPIMTKVLKTFTRTINSSAYIEISAEKAGTIALLTTLGKTSFRITDGGNGTDLTSAVEQASNGLNIVTLTTKGEGSLKLSRT